VVRTDVQKPRHLKNGKKLVFSMFYYTPQPKTYTSSTYFKNFCCKLGSVKTKCYLCIPLQGNSTQWFVYVKAKQTCVKVPKSYDV